MLIAVAFVGIAEVSVKVAWLHPVTTEVGVQGFVTPDDDSTTPVTVSGVLTPATTYVTVYDAEPGAQEIALVGFAGGVVEAVPVIGEVRTRAMAVLVRQVPPPQPFAPLVATLLIV
jgi:hypothetical protein